MGYENAKQALQNSLDRLGMEYIDIYLKEFAKLYNNTLFIWNEYDTLKTLVYFNSNLVTHSA